MRLQTLLDLGLHWLFELLNCKHLIFLWVAIFDFLTQATLELASILMRNVDSWLQFSLKWLWSLLFWQRKERLQFFFRGSLRKEWSLSIPLRNSKLFNFCQIILGCKDKLHLGIILIFMVNFFQKIWLTRTGIYNAGLITIRIDR